MKKSYFILEQGTTLLDAVKLHQDPQLQNGFGQRLLLAFKEGKEMELFKTLKKEEKYPVNIHRICSESYRKSGHNMKLENKLEKAELTAEYAYVLKKQKLYVYHHRNLLFSVTHENITPWLKLIKNLDYFYHVYLYREDILNYDWSRETALFQTLLRRLNKEGTFPEIDKKQYPLFSERMFLQDCKERKCISYGYHTQPYQIKWKHWCNGKYQLYFIFEHWSHGWYIKLFMPYGNKRFFNYPYFRHETENAAILHLCSSINRYTNEWNRLAEIQSIITQLMQEFSKNPSLDEHELKEMFRQLGIEQKWFGSKHAFSPENLIQGIFESSQYQ